MEPSSGRRPPRRRPVRQKRTEIEMADPRRRCEGCHYVSAAHPDKVTEVMNRHYKCCREWHDLQAARRGLRTTPAMPETDRVGTTTNSSSVPAPRRLAPQSSPSHFNYQQPYPPKHAPLHHPALPRPDHSAHYETFPNFANSVPFANQAHVPGFAPDGSLLHQNYHYIGLTDPTSLYNQVPLPETSESQSFPHLSGNTHPAPAPLPSNQSLVPQSHFYHDIPGQYSLPSSSVSQNRHNPNFDNLPLLQQAAPSLPVDYNPWMYPDLTGILGQERSEEWQRSHQQHSLEKRIRAPRLTRRQALRYGDALE